MKWNLLIATIALLTIAAACGGGSDNGEEQTTQASPTDTVAPTTEPTPTPTPTVRSSEPGQAIEGGTLVRGWRDPPTLDPHLTTDSTSATIIVEVFGGLVTIDLDLKIVPDLAEGWSVSADGRTYMFNLRENAKFHSGKPVTAQDVKWSIERAVNPLTAAPVVDQYLGDIVGVDERLNGDADEVTGIRVIDQRTVEIATDASKSYFLAKLTYPTAFVLDQENVETGRRWFREPNGTGPFKLDEYVPGERLVLARNENFHLAPPKLDKVRFILSGGTTMLMYENDEIHLAGVGVADLDRVLDPNNSLNAELQRAPPTFSVDYIGMNVNVPPFEDQKIRQAMNYAIDKSVIARDVLANLVAPAAGILPPGFPAYNEDLSGYAYDPDKAQQLLRESTYGSAENLPPIILTTAGSFGSGVSLDLEVVLEMWRQNLGIQVEIQQTEFATYLQDLNKRRFQMFQIGWIADYPDPENFLDILFHGGSSNNHTGIDNLELNSILEQARTERDESRRFDLYHQAEELVVDQAPWVPLWYSGEQYLLVKPNVKDYFLTPLVIPKLRHVYFTEE